VKGVRHPAARFVNPKVMLDKSIFQPYYFPMSKDPYSEMTNQDHAEMSEWFDEREQAFWDDGGPDNYSRCNCEDYPCCGH